VAGKSKFADSDPNQREPLPPPTGPAPYRLPLSKVLGNNLSATKMVFHILGDSGGVVDGTPQIRVAEKLTDQLEDGLDEEKPLFLYHLGDVVYFNGEWASYYAQYFNPYAHYLAPIFAIPGNHDGSVNPTDSNSGIQTFVKVFCDTAPRRLPIAQNVNRDTMIQPNVYWTLQTPLANIIGLYTNVSESEGYVDDTQKAWFLSELKNAQTERGAKALIVALHHPVYSVDRDHGASTVMRTLLDTAFSSTGIAPDLVLTGHVHNYQRFTRTFPTGSQAPYIVCGNGGYYHHSYVDQKNAPVQTPNSSVYGDGIRFEKYCEDHWGFMRLTIDSSNGLRTLTAEYFNAPLPSELGTAPAVLFDSFQIELKANRVKTLPT